jgi:cell division protein FtsL
MKRKIFWYAMVISIPLGFGLVVWQSARYSQLAFEVQALNERQEERIEDNKRLIADVAVLSSSARIEKDAKTKLGLEKKNPEDVLQVIVGNE